MHSPRVHSTDGGPMGGAERRPSAFPRLIGSFTAEYPPVVLIVTRVYRICIFFPLRKRERERERKRKKESALDKPTRRTQTTRAVVLSLDVKEHPPFSHSRRDNIYSDRE